jgi:hypothetical protein
MNELITGLPGGGKTLLALAILAANAKSSSPRPVFVHGIPDLDKSLLWAPLPDPTTWHVDVPEGALVIIDECQHWFPPRPSGSKVPDYISAFETHRHRGLDFVLISQHPKLIDQNLRRLIERHRHVTRVFGSSFQNVYEWNTCNESPEPPQNLKSANCKRQRFDKSLFLLYKSATQHTHRARLPWRRIGVGIVAIVVCIGLVGKFLVEKTAQASPSIHPSTQQVVTPTTPSVTSLAPAPGPQTIYTLVGIVRLGPLAYPRYLIETPDGVLITSDDLASHYLAPGKFCFKVQTQDEEKCIPMTIRG